MEPWCKCCSKRRPVAYHRPSSQHKEIVYAHPPGKIALQQQLQLHDQQFVEGQANACILHQVGITWPVHELHSLHGGSQPISTQPPFQHVLYSLSSIMLPVVYSHGLNSKGTVHPQRAQQL